MYGCRLIPGGRPVSRALVQAAILNGTQTFPDQQVIDEQAEQQIDCAEFLHRAENDMAVIARQRRFLTPMLVKPRQQTAAHHVAVFDAYVPARSFGILALGQNLRLAIGASPQIYRNVVLQTDVKTAFHVNVTY